MIVKFNPAVFDTQDREINRATLKIIFEFFEDGFLWDKENIDAIYGDDGSKFYTSVFAKSMLTEGLITQLNEIFDTVFQKSAYLTRSHQHYLSTITIGLEEGEIHPILACRQLSYPSILVLENGDNDWNFIRGLLLNFKNQRDRKTIYSLIDKAIDQNRLISEHAGGSGGILRRSTTLSVERYHGIFKHKVAIIFDSDRQDHTELNHKWVPLLKWLKDRDFNNSDSNEYKYSEDDKIRWHMLYKREMENYLPCELLYLEVDFDQITIEKLDSLSSHEHDFYNFDPVLNSPHLKNTLPLAFQKAGIKMILEERCAHHKVQIVIPSGILEEVSEPEELLLMIAKII